LPVQSTSKRKQRRGTEEGSSEQGCRGEELWWRRGVAGGGGTGLGEETVTEWCASERTRSAGCAGGDELPGRSGASAGTSFQVGMSMAGGTSF